MQQKAFSIIEIIFTLAIISILLIVAVPKIKDIFTTASKTQVKSTITLIREGIVKEKNKLLLANSLENLNSLDDGDKKLFSKVLKTPIIEGESWIRIGTNSYQVFIDNTKGTVFTYDPNTYSFDCNYEEALCKELTH